MKYRYIILALICFCTVLAIVIRPTPQNRSPQQAWDYVVKCYTAKNPEAASPHLTAEGRKVADWLFAQPWILKKMAPEILKTRDETNRYEIYLRFNESDGIETCSLIFHKENGVWKFQDVYLDNMKGDNFGMYLSEFIENPISANLKFAINHPGKVFKGFADGVDSVITWIGTQLDKGVNFMVWQLLKILIPVLCVLFIYDWFRTRLLKKS